MDNELSIDDILGEEESPDKIIPEGIAPVVGSISDLHGIPVAASEDIKQLRGRLQMWEERCRDIFVDLRTVDYTVTDEDSYLEFQDKSYYNQRLYFKVDPQNPRDPKVIHAHQQLCRILGIPYGFFASNRPTLKMNIVKTWQAGLTADEKKCQSVLKIRESKDCSIIRAFIPTSKCSVPLHDLVGIIMDTVSAPMTLEFVCGDGKDDLTLHARFIFDKEYQLFSPSVPVYLGFSLVASELDASPLMIDVLIHDKIHATSYIATYGGDSFFRSKYEGVTASQIRDLFPKMISRIDAEAPEMLYNIAKKVQSSYDDPPFCPSSECTFLMRSKGFSSKIRKAIYQQVTECLSDIKNPWDLAMHAGLVAKDYDSIKRLDVERAIGKYLQLTFGKE